MNLVQMSLSGAVMILAIIVVRVLAINRLPKKVFVLLWYVVLFRLWLLMEYHGYSSGGIGA